MAKKDSAEERALLVEANKINYRLRSTFFYRKLHEYGSIEMPAVIAALIPSTSSYIWDKHADWGISDDAFDVVSNSDISFIQAFAHPKLIRENSRLIAYYRHVAALSQKSVSMLISKHPKRFEEAEVALSISESEALEFVKLFNEHVSLIIESALEDFKLEELNALLLASTGAQIDGSWRNSIGLEAEHTVQNFLVREAIKRSILKDFMMRKDSSRVTYDPHTADDILKNIGLIKGFVLKNGNSVLFSSEPDVELIDGHGMSVLVVEVKGGADPAGALERYGAAKKSFGESLKDNPDVETCLLASCITAEVNTRIQADGAFTCYYNLTNIITDEDVKEDFLDYFFSKAE